MKKYLFLLALLIALAGCGSKTETPTVAPDAIDSFSVTPGDYPVSIVDHKFDPAEIKFEPGTRVIWTNNDSVPHSIVSKDLPEINSPELNTGEKYEFTVNKKGTFSYNCGIHPDMEGKLIVK